MISEVPERAYFLLLVLFSSTFILERVGPFYEWQDE